MSECDATILKAVAAELKARLREAENEPMPSEIASVLFAVHRAELAASKPSDDRNEPL